MPFKKQESESGMPARCPDAAHLPRRKCPFFRTLGDLSVGVRFGVVENLAVQFLPGTLFIDRYVHGNFPSERNLVPWHSLLVPVLTGNHSVGILHHISEEHWE